jgi:hypothetical protein
MRTILMPQELKKKRRLFNREEPPGTLLELSLTLCNNRKNKKWRLGKSKKLLVN